VNRLQARLDEEEFGMVEAPAAVKTSPPKETPETSEEQVDEAAEIQKPDAPAAPTVETNLASSSTDAASTAAVAEGADKLVKPIEGLSDKGLSFEQKKKERAKRFGIAVTEAPSSSSAVKQASDPPGKKRSEDKEASPTNKKQKTAEAKEEPLLPKEEIEKRLKRAEKFNMNNETTDKLKAMLRKHRFMEANPSE
jgi:SAP domain-containing ribonucleoprotein